MENCRYKLVLKMSLNKNLKVNDTQIVNCYTLDDCIKQSINFIKRHHLTSQQWKSGQVYCNEQYHGRVGYDGVFYDATTEEGKLPELDDQIEEANSINEYKSKTRQYE